MEALGTKEAQSLKYLYWNSFKAYKYILYGYMEPLGGVRSRSRHPPEHRNTRERGPYIGTLRSKYLLYGYMEPLGKEAKGTRRRKGAPSDPDLARRGKGREVGLHS